MTNQEVLCTALRQSAIDSGCSPEDFTRPEHVVVRSRANPAARRYLQLPFFCDLVSYGSNVVASVSPEIEVPVRAYVNARTPEQCFETPDIYCLNEALAGYGVRVHHMAEYFLPDVTALHALPCRYETRLLRPAEFAAYYTPQWANALCAQRRELDVLAMGAFDGQTLVGRLQHHVADWRGRAGAVQAAGHCQCAYQQPCGGGIAPGACALLLLCMGECKICPQRLEKRLSPRMGAADGKADPRKKAGPCLKQRCRRGAKLFSFFLLDGRGRGAI